MSELICVEELPRYTDLSLSHAYKEGDVGPLGAYGLEPTTNVVVDHIPGNSFCWNVTSEGEFIETHRTFLGAGFLATAMEWRAIFYRHRAIVFSDNKRAFSSHRLLPFAPDPGRMSFSDAFDRLANMLEKEKIRLETEDYGARGVSLRVSRKDKAIKGDPVSVLVAGARAEKADEAMGVILWNLSDSKTKLCAEEHGAVRGLLREWMQGR